MTALLEKVLAQASQLPDAEQDAVAARLRQALTEFEQEKQQEGEKPRPQFGSAKGLGHMTPDFDEPLEEFKKNSRSMPMHHRDSFDRLIIAKSVVENMAVASTDRAFDAYGVTRLW